MRQERGNAKRKNHGSKNSDYPVLLTAANTESRKEARTIIVFPFVRVKRITMEKDA